MEKKLAKINEKMEKLENEKQKLNVEISQNRKKIIEILNDNFISEGNVVKFPIDLTKAMKLHKFGSNDFEGLLLEHADKKFQLIEFEIFGGGDFEGAELEQMYFRAKLDFYRIWNYFGLSCIPEEVKNEYDSVAKKYNEIEKEIGKLKKWSDSLACALKLEGTKIE